MSSFYKYIIDADRALQQLVNQRIRNSVLDVLAPVLREPKAWIPLYLFLAIWVPVTFGRKGIYWCLSFIITFGIGDFLSASVIKPLVGRIRPCNDPVFAAEVRNLVDCGVGYSFPSTHATNHFALAVFMGLTLGRFYKWIPAAAICWAFAIGCAQVYVGVHYPFDVAGGALLGVLVGTFTAMLFMRKVGLSQVDKSE